MDNPVFEEDEEEKAAIESKAERFSFGKVKIEEENFLKFCFYFLINQKFKYKKNKKNSMKKNS